jgi:hypothetical protein
LATKAVEDDASDRDPGTLRACGIRERERTKDGERQHTGHDPPTFEL